MYLSVAAVLIVNHFLVTQYKTLLFSTQDIVSVVDLKDPTYGSFIFVRKKEISIERPHVFMLIVFPILQRLQVNKASFQQFIASLPLNKKPFRFDYFLIVIDLHNLKNSQT